MYEGSAAKKELTAKEVIERKRAFAERKRRRYIQQTNPKLYRLLEYQDARPERAKIRAQKMEEAKTKIIRLPAEMLNMSFLDYVLVGLGKRRSTVSKSFVIFLSVVSILAVSFCVNFIQTRAELTQRIGDVARLETELMTLRNDNDAYEASLKGNVNINAIKNIAIQKLGMQYPKQVVFYEKSKNCNRFVQYQDIPEN